MSRLAALALGLLLVGAPFARAATITELQEVVVNDDPRRIAELRERIWSTPLGLLVNEFLFEDQTPAQVTRRSHQISTRVYGSVRLKLARLSALHIMYMDLYERGEVDSKVQLRIDQLNTEIDLKHHVNAERLSTQALRVAPAFLALGALGGSPLVREQTTSAVESLLIKSGIERRAAPHHPLRLLEPGFLGVLRREFFTHYSFSRAAEIGLSGWAGTSALYWFFMSGADEGSGLEERVVSYFLESHTRLEDL